MNTDDLIGALAAGVRPTPPGSAMRRLVLAMALGGAAALVGVLAVLGPRADLPQAVATGAFWIKAAYTAALAFCGLFVLHRLSRPGASAGWAWLTLAAVTLVVFALASAELMQAAPHARTRMVMGHSAMLCPGRILAFATPVYAALVWAFRNLAPTRLALAGFAGGLVSGAVGATAYGLACTEHTAAFLAVWYTIGVLAAGAVGALLGPRLLRW